MNLAFSTVLIFLIVLPGIILRRTYFSGQFSKNYVKLNLSDEIVWAIIPGLLIQSIAVLFLEGNALIQFNFEELGILLIGSGDEKLIAQAASHLKCALPYILIYNVSIWIVAALAGYLSQKTVRVFKLDRKLRFFRFNNEWHYILSGEILDFRSMEGSSTNVNYVYVDALVDKGGSSIIYTGRLREYFLSRDGELDSICLTQVKRRNYEGQSGVHNEIPGEFMVIRAGDILNLNVRYYKDVDQKPDKKKEGLIQLLLLIFSVLTIVLLVAFLYSLTKKDDPKD